MGKQINPYNASEAVQRIEDFYGRDDEKQQEVINRSLGVDGFAYN